MTPPAHPACHPLTQKQKGAKFFFRRLCSQATYLPKCAPGVISSENSIAFGSAPRREADSQPISQLVRQAVSQAVNRASRQADRQTETHSLGFFSGRLGYKQRGAWRVPEQARSNGNAVGCQPAGRWSDSWTADCRPRRSTCVPPDPCSNPSEHKLLTPSTPRKSDIQVRIEASESKNILGDRFIGQNNDFTRGWTSNIMPWGMLRE